MEVYQFPPKLEAELNCNQLNCLSQIIVGTLPTSGHPYVFI